VWQKQQEKPYFLFLQQKNTPKKFQIKQRRGKKGTYFFFFACNNDGSLGKKKPT
jgi:hypothetical protein